MPNYWLGGTPISADDARYLYGQFLGDERALKIELRGFRELSTGLSAILKMMAGGPPMQMAMRDIVTGLQSKVRGNEPKDMGILKASTIAEVRAFGDITTGIVGTPMIHGLAHELGTGTFIGQRPHYPPPTKLVGWVRRKLTSWVSRSATGGRVQRYLDELQVAFIVSRIIGRRGGLRPLKFFERSLNEYWPTIQRKIQRAIVGIIESR